MTLLIRWAKFAAVGAMGSALQLVALALLNGWRPGHYLVASTIAIELALLHNFAWHALYTWRDRPGGSAGQQFVRFHFSNGLVSMAGNLILMRMLVGTLAVPVIAANALAIAACGFVNFWLGDTWVFATRRA